MKSRNSVIVHLVFWLFILLFVTAVVIYSKEPVSLRRLAVNFGYSGLIHISIFYINYTLLIPLLIKESKRYGLYIVSIILLMVVMSFIKTVIAVLNPETILQNMDSNGVVQERSIANYAISALFISGFFIVVSSLLKLAIDWFGNERTQRNLESEKKEM